MRFGDRRHRVPDRVRGDRSVQRHGRPAGQHQPVEPVGVLSDKRPVPGGNVHVHVQGGRHLASVRRDARRLPDRRPGPPARARPIRIPRHVREDHKLSVRVSGLVRVHVDTVPATVEHHHVRGRYAARPRRGEQTVLQRVRHTVPGDHADVQRLLLSVLPDGSVRDIGHGLHAHHVQHAVHFVLVRADGPVRDRRQIVRSHRPRTDARRRRPPGNTRNRYRKSALPSRSQAAAADRSKGIPTPGCFCFSSQTPALLKLFNIFCTFSGNENSRIDDEACIADFKSIVSDHVRLYR